MSYSSRGGGFEAGITDRGLRHARKYRLFQEHWHGHLVFSREAILRGAMQAKPGSAVVLGAGDGKEIPLRELLQYFERVTLVDVDEASLGRLLDSLPAEQKQRVRTTVADLTGGTLRELTAQSAQLIERSATARQAYRGLAALYESMASDEARPLDWLSGLQASYVVSSMVASQLMPYPEHWIGQQFQAKFGKKPTELSGEKYREARDALQSHLVRQHACLLAGLAQQGLVYWSCDVRQELVMGRLGPRHIQQLGEEMTAYLETVDWEALSLEFEVAPASGGEFTAYLTALIGKGFLPVQLELDIIEYMMRAAQALEPGAVNQLIGGEMAQYFDGLLKPVVEPSTWLWHLDPAHFYQGGIHQVEAWLLRPGTAIDY